MVQFRFHPSSSLRLLLLALGIAGVGAPLPRCQNLKNFDLVKISEGVYATVARPGGDAVSNAGFVITDKWVCVFDAHMTEDAGRELLDEIRRVTYLPIRYLVTSHFHGDHTHGSQALPSDVEVISTHSTRENLLNRDLPQLQRYQQVLPVQIERLRKELSNSDSPERSAKIQQELSRREEVLRRIAGLELVIPGLTFARNLSLRTLENEIKILFLGRGHTDGDLVLWLPEQRILFAGDLVFHGTLPNMVDGFSKEWVETLGEIRKLRPEVIVPGHGPVGDDSMLADSRDYLRSLRRTVKANMDEGQTLEEMIGSMRIPARYRAYQFQEFYPGNIDKVYREFIEEAAGQPPPKP